MTSWRVMMIAVDTNVLVYAHRAETPMHIEADLRMKALSEGSTPWAIPLPCISEFLRVVTHPGVFRPPSEISEALGFVASLVESPTCKLLRPGPDCLDYLFQAMVSAGVRGNLVFDAQIAALCREHGVKEILTNDRDFNRFEGMEIELLGSVHEPQAGYSSNITVRDFLKNRP